MKNLLLRIYDYLAIHRRVLWIIGAVLSVMLIVAAVTLRYNENIMDFLPVSQEDRQALNDYMTQQSASRIVLIIEGDSLREEALSDCMDRIADQMPHVSLDDMAGDQMLSEFYRQLPCLIADSTYDRLDSLFTPEAIRAALERDRTILSTPGTSMLIPAIQNDPLGLVDLSSVGRRYANRTYAFCQTPYGSTETQRNAALVDSLQALTDQVALSYPELSIRWVGAPVIAVSNSRRIKIDSIVCIALALVLIIALLFYAFPRKRDIWLILLSVTFGWLIGMAVLRLITPTVSLIVLGIGSVLIGIAVNYPLHLLVHQRYTSSVRQTLQEVLSPLVIGNITTVGAFLTLVPLQATALRDLGIFAASMLIGTILFCIFVLPHLMSAEPTPVREISLPSRWLKTNIERVKRVAQWTVIALTALFGIYLLLSQCVNGICVNGKWFDSNLQHINYLTPQQRADLASFDPAANSSAGLRWQAYFQTHSADTLIARIRTQAEALDFNPDAFQPFYDCVSDWQPTPVFDMGRLTRALSDDFNYIGLCCSLIVFVFLWLSFRSLAMAAVAFVPMALSWIWILALMQLFGLQFNIVNIILATFIFGQGDDYTIFVVEGLLYERRTGKPMLAQYRQSILLSALIMLFGIGILVFAVHPAMHSLGVVTLIGMGSVVLMALTVPPLLMRYIPYPRG